MSTANSSVTVRTLLYFMRKPLWFYRCLRDTVACGKRRRMPVMLAPNLEEWCLGPKNLPICQRRNKGNMQETRASWIYRLITRMSFGSERCTAIDVRIVSISRRDWPIKPKWGDQSVPRAAARGGGIYWSCWQLPTDFSNASSSSSSSSSKLR